jgi:RNA polymerase sigma factor (sigma-70 family)
MQTDGFRDLVRKAQAGDSEARDQLFQAALPLIERVVRRSAWKVRPDESLSDRVQDVCRRLLVKLDQFCGACEAPDDEQAWKLFGGWVRQIVHSVGVNAHRKRDDHEPLPAGAGDSTNTGGCEPAANEQTPSANVRADERSRLVLEAVNKLPDPLNREIVRLRFFEDLSLREIAERLQLTYDVVRERFRLSKRRLQRELEGLQ